MGGVCGIICMISTATYYIICTGYQDNRADIQRWVEESGGNFDVIVDDGGHRNSHILNTFMGLWRALKPGGLYFIEDLQVGRDWQYRGTSEFVVGEVMLYDICICIYIRMYMYVYIKCIYICIL